MHVRPLWLHTFPPSHAPKLSFIGLPWRCAKMPQFQLQGQLLARLLSGRAKLPAQQDMEQVGDWIMSQCWYCDPSKMARVPVQIAKPLRAGQ